MGCGLQDIVEGHERHYCHKCVNVSFLGSQNDDRPCKTCLDIGNCNFAGLKRQKIQNMRKQTSKDAILEKLKRAVPGTTSIESCEKLEYCFTRKIRMCMDIKAVCIRCIERGNVIGGLTFPFGIKIEGKNPIMIYRFGQSDSYMTAIEGKGFDDVISKFEKEPIVKEITERTRFIRNEKKEFEDNQKIEAFKRSKVDVLVVQKNKLGEYEDIEKKLIEVAKEKEKETGIKIKIIDRAEIVKNVYIFGITNEKLVEKLEIDAETMFDVDGRLLIFVFPGEFMGKYKGALTIDSLEDDILENNIEKDILKKYFMEKYGKGLCFIGKETTIR